MKIYLKQLFASLLILSVSLPIFAVDAPKREVRAVWLATVWGLDWPSTAGTSESAKAAQKAQMIKYLDQLQGMKINTVYFQVRGMSDAMYKSSYEPWSSYLSGTRGADPGWDPLEFTVAECHKRGMECHAWINPYRFTTSTSWDTPQDQEVKNSGVLLTYNSTVIWNPAKQASIDRIKNVCTEIARNYKVDGILFDDYFYPNGIPSNSTAGDYQDFLSSGTKLSIQDWRRDNVNEMVRQVYKAIQDTRGDLRFGISPAGVAGTKSTSASKYGVNPCPVGSDWQYNGIFSDPLAWLNDGSIDYISPQIYWTMSNSSQPFGPITEWWGYVAEHFGRHHYASHSLEFMAPDKSGNNETSWADVAAQIEASRSTTLNNAPGCVFYSTKYINGPYLTGLGDYLKKNSFPSTALAPVITWKKGANYNAVSNLKLNGTTISWDAVVNGNAIVKYTVYAIPYSTPMDEIQETNGDGFKKDYLLGISYENTFDITSDKLNDFWYAVCVYDGNGIEYTPATLNAPNGESEKPTLQSPINGNVADWNQKFTWSVVADATYTFELSDKADFSNLIISEKKLTANSIDIYIGSLNSSTQYFWRIKTWQKGKLESVSDVASFTTMQKAQAPKANLLTPANGTETTTDYILFSWSKVDASCSLEISKNDNFNDIVYSASVENKNISEIDVPASILGKGNFFWRVKSSGELFENTYSETGHFSVKSFEMGSHEAGYYTKYDPATYSETLKMTLHNQWFRVLANDANNTTFNENGSLNRGFCVAGDFVYVAGRAQNSATAQSYLRKFDIKTGEIISDVILSSEVQGESYPCNDVIKDSKGNICVTNYSTSIINNPLKVYQVNTNDGSVVLRASCQISGRVASQVDHAAIYGDVSTGNFSVFTVISNAKVAYRWTYVDGVLTASDKCTLASTYPSSANVVGFAPKVIPVDANKFFVVGSTTALSLYDFSTGTMSDSFLNNEILAPTTFSANGGTFFTLNGKKYIVYPLSDATSELGYTFNIVRVDDNMDFSSMQLLWTLPAEGLGKNANDTYQADVDYLPLSDSEGRLFIYVPGNGIAAYNLKDVAGAGVDDNLINDGLKISVSRNIITFSQEVENAEFYNMAGVLVSKLSNVTSTHLNVLPGVYVVNATADGTNLKQLIVIK